jgi:hypothetical protein
MSQVYNCLNSIRRNANLIDVVGSTQIVDRELTSGCTEFVKRGPHPLRVLSGRPNPNVKVTRCAGRGVRPNRMGADNEIFSAGVVQGAQHLSEILVQQRFRPSLPTH